MASLNKVQIIGHLGNDPEVRYLPDGTPVATVSVATTEHWKDKAGEKKEKTEWHRVEAFGRLAEIIGQYARKGSMVYVEGSLSTDKYTDKEGVERYSTKVRAQSIQLLDRRGAEQGSQDGQGGQSQEGPGQAQDAQGYSDDRGSQPSAAQPTATAATNAPKNRRLYAPKPNPATQA